MGPTVTISFIPNPVSLQITSNSTTLYTIPANQFGEAVMSSDNTGGTLSAAFQLNGSNIMQDSNANYADSRTYWLPTGTTLQWGSVSGTGRYNFVVSLFNS